MTQADIIFLGILLLNTLGVIAYFIVVGFILTKEKKKRNGHFIRAIIMFLCPIVGPMFFLMEQLISHFFFKQDADLADVIFSKERVKTRKRADEDQEGNMVPIEEALAISDTSSVRTLMMNVVRGDVKNSLFSIALALNSEDTETSHYAAAVLRDELNDFRSRVQEMYKKIKDGDKQAAEYACVLLEYMNGVLYQNVFLESEQKTFVDMMEDVADYLYQNNRDLIIPEYLEWMCVRLMGVKEYERMEVWCDRSSELYPNELFAYTCQLKLYFTIQNKERFFQVLDSLKKSDVVIDKETLELIRIFS